MIITKKNGYTVIQIKSAFILKNAVRFDLSIKESLDKNEKHVILDLELIDYISSTDIAILVKIKKLLVSMGIETYLMNVNNNVYSILKITTLHSVFNIINNENVIVNLVKKNHINDLLDPFSE
jgi:anti-anti-sigma factor